MVGNSLIDNDFIEEPDLDDPFVDPHAEARKDFQDDVALESDQVDVEIVDDTPDEDKGKWIIDPEKDGEPEDVSDEELQNYSDNVKNRISKLTARAHAERRAAEEKDRQLSELYNVASNLLNQNNNLKGMLEDGEKILLGEHRGRLESQLQSVKNAYKEAHEAGDTEGMVAAQEQMARVAASISQVQSHRPNHIPREDPALFQQYQRPQVPQPSMAAQEWRQKNPWFDTNPAMQAYALARHGELVQSGVQADSPEYYSAIDKDIRERFPENFETREPKRRAVTVAPANRSSDGKKRKTVRLTQSQIDIANKLGITPEQMAQEVLLTEGGQRKRSYG